ncbi:MAG TPA: protein kinase family protein, partial [Polyangia bacterium]
LDFGISKDLDAAVGAALTRPDIAIGTPVYMAPEQAAGKSADALTDVYAVGGLLYEMLTAEPPCRGDDAMEVLQRKATEDPRPIGEVRPDLPRDVQKLVTRALARAPNDRHWSMTAFKEQILACLTSVGGAPSPVRGFGGSPGPSRPPLGSAAAATAQPITGITTAPVKRIRLGGATVAAAILVVGVAIAGVAYLNGRPSTPPPPTPIAAAPAPPPAAAPALAAALPAMLPAASEGRKTLAASARHVEPADPTPAVLRAPAARHSAPIAAPEPGAVKPAPPSAPPLPPASLVDTTAILDHGQSAFDRGDYQEAIRQGRKAIAAGAEINGRLLVGDVYFHLERYREAVREYNAALARDPGDASARRRRDLAQEKASQSGAR